MIKTKHIVFGLLFATVFILSIIFPRYNFWLLIALILLIVSWFLASPKFWKRLDKKVEGDNLVGEEEVPQ